MHHRPPLAAGIHTWPNQFPAHWVPPGKSAAPATSRPAPPSPTLEAGTAPHACRSSPQHPTANASGDRPHMPGNMQLPMNPTGNPTVKAAPLAPTWNPGPAPNAVTESPLYLDLPRSVRQTPISLYRTLKVCADRRQQQPPGSQRHTRRQNSPSRPYSHEMSAHDAYGRNAAANMVVQGSWPRSNNTREIRQILSTTVSLEGAQW